MVGEASTFIVMRQPVCPLLKKTQGNGVIQPQLGVTFNAGQQRKRRSPTSPLIGEIIITRPISMGTVRRVEYPSFHPIANCWLLVEGVIWHIGVISQCQRPDKFLCHTTGEVNNFVLPEVAVKA